MNFTALVKKFCRVGAISAILMMVCLVKSHATHLRAGEITAVRENCNSLTFIITVRVYTNTKNTTVLFGGDQDVLNFGDGNTTLVPETPNTIRLDLDSDGSVATASYTIRHTYSGIGQYTISYREPNRNEGVLNMDASVNTTFYLETVVNIDPFLGCNNTPILLVPPIDHACPGVTWTHNPGAYDPDGDSLSYSMQVPYSDRNTQVINYKDPNNSKFYTDFGHANEAGTGPPTFSFDPTKFDGTIIWDAPGAIGEYNIAFHIIEWRKRNGQWYQMGYVRRDMQILVDDCKNQRPDMIVPNDTCVVAGTELKATIFGTDPDKDPVKIEAFSEIFNYPAAQSPATYAPVPGVNDFVPSDPPAETKFDWQTQCLHVKDQPYQVVFKITDKPKNGPRLVTFKTWLIKVVGPAPEWVGASLVDRRTSLQWDPYFCQNATSMQIWRKVDGSPFEPDNCQTGMPAYLGYELIDVVGIKDEAGNPVTKYTDSNKGNGLAPGAKYCYRLVAVFPLPKGGESYVSKDICVGPVPSDVPTITHVSVEKTDITAGQIRVSWKKPLEPKVQFVQPFHYDIWRAVGFARGQDSTKITPTANFADTTFLDQGVNSEENVYNYSIACYDATGAFVGNSATASSVRLDAKSQVKKIELNWSAFVPWSNQIQSVPNKHLIYRGPEGATEADLVLIDSVDVSSSGFIYLDEGQWNGTALDDNTTYCYRIMTRGGYGNPKIPQPLNNFSQIMCAQPGDTIPPCKLEPPIRSTADFKDCDDYFTKFCDRDTYANVLYWNRAKDASCRNDVRSYNIYYTNKKGGEYALLANTTDTTYTDANLRSFARCYKIAAVDRSGNEGELSEEMCIDNCPHYELPNVFTPNGDKYNELFSAYSLRGYECGEEGNCPIPIEIMLKCARFVEQVEFKVFNRWGEEVYHYDTTVGDQKGSIYIDWNGRDNSGSELSTGVYYFVAKVKFITVDPGDQVQNFKGWVHLIR